MPVRKKSLCHKPPRLCVKQLRGRMCAQSGGALAPRKSVKMRLSAVAEFAGVAEFAVSPEFREFPDLAELAELSACIHLSENILKIILETSFGPCNRSPNPTETPCLCVERVSVINLHACASNSSLSLQEITKS